MIRAIRIALALALFTTTTTTAAADVIAFPVEPDRIVEADLGSGVIGAAFEKRILPRLTARATVQLERPWYTGIVGGHETDAIGFGVELRPFIFPLADGPAGLYVSPFGRLCAIKSTDDLPKEASGAAWSAGITAGYGWLLAHDRLLLRFGAGVQYWGFKLDEGAGVDGLYPDVDIIVGYTF